MVFGAGETAIDMGGSVLLPGAWPLLRAAYQPVIDNLKQRLGLDDADRPSAAQAEELVKAFAADTHLQSMFASAVVEKLAPFVSGQAAANDDIKRLIEIVGGNADLLEALQSGTGRIEARLETGVNLSDEAVRKVAEQVEIVQHMHALTLREVGLASELMKRQLQRLQVRADELLEEGAPDRAADELREGIALLALMLNSAPSDMDLQVQLGFMYKTIAQLCERVGDAAASSEYLDRAEEVFTVVKKGIATGLTSGLQAANALHGMCNVRHAKRDLAGAVACYQQVVELCPEHPYAWHDMFLAYYELAKEGKPADLPAMRHALEQLTATGAGLPGIGAAKLKTMQGMLNELEQDGDD